jgi:iron complex outermembrane receptor protein
MVSSRSLVFFVAFTACAPLARADEPGDEPVLEVRASVDPERGRSPRDGTASLTGARLEETASSLTVIDAATLERRGAVDLEQALAGAAGVQPFLTYGGFTRVLARGFSAVMLEDGLRDGRAALVMSAPQGGLWDVERLEILRGPASLLYGWGAIGGVVNRVRRAPDGRRELRASVGAGLPREWSLTMHAGGELHDTLSYRVDGGTNSYATYRANRMRRTGATLSLGYEPARGHRFIVRTSGARNHFGTDTGIPTVDGELPHWSVRGNRYNTPRDALDQQSLSAELDYRYRPSERLSIEARVRAARDDYDYLSAELLSLETQGTASLGDDLVERASFGFGRRFRPLNAQLVARGEAGGRARHHWAAAYSFDGMFGHSDRFDATATEPGIADRPMPPLSYLHPVETAGRLPTPATGRSPFQTTTHGLSVHDRVELPWRIQLLAGARMDRFQRRTRQDHREQVSDPFARGETNEFRDLAFTYQLGAVANPITPLYLYAGYATGYQPVTTVSADGRSFDPERANQLEGGVRLRFDGLLELDVAGYFIRKSKVLRSLGMGIYDQAARVVSRGADLDLRLTPHRAVAATLGYSYVDARFGRYDRGSESLDGNALRLVAPHTAVATVVVRPIEAVEVMVGGRVYSALYADDENELRLPGYGLVDASIGLVAEHVTVRLVARNLLDHRAYYTSVIGTQVTPGASRELMATLELRQ